MPIYEYHCPGCDNLFEEWCQRVDDEKTKPCPTCGKQAKRIISQTSFALKGDGWYVTEYGAKKGINEQGASADSSKDSGAGSGNNAGDASGNSSVAEKSASPTPASSSAKVPGASGVSGTSGASSSSGATHVSGAGVTAP